MIDRGWLDRPIAGWASHKLGHVVQFDSLDAHLLSADPWFAVRHLTIYGPKWALGSRLAQVDALEAHLELRPLLWGEVRIPTLILEHPRLRLIRLRDGRNNWTMRGTSPSRPPFAVLAGTRTFRIKDGELSFADNNRDVRFTGTFSQDGRPSLPFALRGRGQVREGEFELAARGGPLHGASVRRPYPFVAHLADGRLSLDAKGTSGQPFDLVRYDLAIASRGPNLADLAYLFDLKTPNSAPFSLTTHAKANGPLVSFGDLTGRTGKSDFTGWIRSDQTTPRHKVTAHLRSSHWSREDVEAWLSPVPPRAIARSTSGRLLVKPRGPWILSDEPFPVDQLRAVDSVSRIQIGSVDGYAVPLKAVKAEIALDHGRLAITKLSANVQGGTLSGNVRLDASRANPILQVKADVHAIDLSRISTPASLRMGGLLDLRIHMRGAGRSVHSAAAAASGGGAIRVTGGRLPRPAAFLLGGDALRAVGTFGRKNDPLSLDCARATFAGSGSKMNVEDFAIVTPEGFTAGQGWLDLATERFSLTLRGQPAHRRLFQVAMPVSLHGSLARPSASLLPARNAEKLGLKGKLGVALSPLAAILPLGKAPPASIGCR
ncbi:AsmA family protein [Sphingomonas abietis]|uniref:AsmA family protein n=1 Tax=Sphingomonas abietis TaxID=3012344 RepID=A0ABY7NUY2_9SPHN|nr:AsmA family protein [Sphingomonas abietis]WBO24367.1 AsmA family protein [Sphingomonas abietis]